MTGTLVLSVVFAVAAVVAAWVSLELGISVALVELVGGVVIGNSVEIYVPIWMSFIAVFAPIVLTFLAGSEIDVEEFRSSWRQSLVLGGASFAFPFAVITDRRAQRSRTADRHHQATPRRRSRRNLLGRCARTRLGARSCLAGIDVPLRVNGLSARRSRALRD